MGTTLGDGNHQWAIRSVGNITVAWSSTYISALLFGTYVARPLLLVSFSSRYLCLTDGQIIPAGLQ
ncbi:hypothetical protein BO85DRAFT_454029 [Aspergillus piperis CBS 112811]|uniref:Uncharacterized protein n=1 Tax=Aspergillus piperis CBS 112811 TaxID=1448313 RepID=A0A8G1QU75_9EURO|nr:hypothetical protein BO85DRAFT_454029 [Aspergillus piperis CBS 112811]RAH52320.1 hypothetical protein BO85DRAFT_454029 [Aspergillus piperis CBS 112811]